MTTLIVPAAGKSTRFGLSRPKFLLTHPSGLSMLSEGLRGLRGAPVDRVIVISLKEYFDGLDPDSLAEEVQSVIESPVSLKLLDKSSPSMVHTIRAGLEGIEEDGPLVVKDCDNYVRPEAFDAVGENFLVFASLNDFPSVTPVGKSYVEIDHNNFVGNIVEKRIISENFNTGMVGFQRISDFLRASSQITNSSELYVSDVVRYLLGNHESFKATKAVDYLDWGTLRAWREHFRSYSTVFVDIDGVLAENENKYAPKASGWERFTPIEENMRVLLDGERAGRMKIVFTTSRTEAVRSHLEAHLTRAGFKSPEILMGLPHGRRVLINDFASTNQYPSATAINIQRNARNLEEYLQ